MLMATKPGYRDSVLASMSIMKTVNICLDEDHREWRIFPEPDSSGVTEVVPLWEIIKQAAEMENDDDMREAVRATKNFDESATILILGDTEPTILEALGQEDISGYIPFPFNLFLKDERFIVSYYPQGLGHEKIY